MTAPLHGFKVGERVVVHSPSQGRSFDRATVVGPRPGRQLEIRYDGSSTALVVPVEAVLHDTTAVPAWLAAEFPADGHVPTWAERRPALAALHADNRHLQPNIA